MELGIDSFIFDVIIVMIGVIDIEFLFFLVNIIVIIILLYCIG